MNPGFRGANMAPMPLLANQKYSIVPHRRGTNFELVVIDNIMKDTGEPRAVL